MTVPTLPWIDQPPLWLFMCMDYGGEALAELLLLMTFVVAISFYISLLCKAGMLWCARKINKAMSIETTCASCLKRTSACLRNCACLKTCRCLPKLLNCVCRKLNVRMYPGLFKERKERYLKSWTSRYNIWGTRKFMLFLDRRVENNLRIKLDFYFLASAILFSALLVFFRYVPVAIGEECIATDENDHNVFCYSESTWAWPVDCAAYNSTVLERIAFSCYSISILDIGVAIAAAAAIANGATLIITIYIRLNECIYMETKDRSRTGRWVSRLYRLYHAGGFIMLIGIAISSYIAVSLIIKSRVETAEGHTKNVHISHMPSCPLC